MRWKCCGDVVRSTPHAGGMGSFPDYPGESDRTWSDDPDGAGHPRSPPALHNDCLHRPPVFVRRVVVFPNSFAHERKYCGQTRWTNDLWLWNRCHRRGSQNQRGGTNIYSSRRKGALVNVESRFQGGAGSHHRGLQRSALRGTAMWCELSPIRRWTTQPPVCARIGRSRHGRLQPGALDQFQPLPLGIGQRISQITRDVCGESE